MIQKADCLSFRIFQISVSRYVLVFGDYPLLRFCQQFSKYESVTLYILENVDKDVLNIIVDQWFPDGYC